MHNCCQVLRNSYVVGSRLFLQISGRKSQILWERGGKFRSNKYPLQISLPRKKTPKIQKSTARRGSMIVQVKKRGSFLGSERKMDSPN